MLEWAPFPAEMPDLDQLYLVFYPDYGIKTARFRGRHWDADSYRMDYDGAIEAPTHWMALPGPPL